MSKQNNETRVGRLAVTMRCMEDAEIAKCSDPESLEIYWRKNIENSPIYDGQKEMLVVLLHDAKLNIYGWSVVSLGTISETLAHPREILRPVIVAGAYGFSIMHNHPSGDTTPSQADTRLTSRIREASELMQIRLLDHVIVGSSLFCKNNRYHSFQEAGLL